MSSGDERPRETFPGGDVVPREGELRVSIEKKAYAEILAHAKEEADVEICGVLIGKLKQDKHGPWLHLQHTIRGEGAKQQGAQVTFTHEAWNHINKVWDRDYPALGIVGWYHTHPGFDIFLSEMDKFIHKSYFDNPHQVAYVYDPHQGTEGFFRKSGEDVVLLDRFWHGGKPRKTLPPEQRVKPSSGSPAAAGGDLAATVTALVNSVRTLEMDARERKGGWLGNLVLLGGLAIIATAVVGFQALYGRPRGEFLPFTVDSKTGIKYYIEVFPEPSRPAAPAEPPPPADPSKK